MSSAQNNAPTYESFKKQPIPDCFNLINNLSIYKVIKTVDKTPPLFYAIRLRKVVDLNAPQATQYFCGALYFNCTCILCTLTEVGAFQSWIALTFDIINASTSMYTGK